MNIPQVKKSQCLGFANGICVSKTLREHKWNDIWVNMHESEAWYKCQTFDNLGKTQQNRQFFVFFGFTENVTLFVENSSAFIKEHQ